MGVGLFLIGFGKLRCISENESVQILGAAPWTCVGIVTKYSATWLMFDLLDVEEVALVVPGCIVVVHANGLVDPPIGVVDHEIWPLVGERARRAILLDT
jgi:hypothetical protein